MRSLGILLLILIAHLQVIAQNSTLKITIIGIQSNEGNIKVAIYDENGESAFLKNLESAFDKKIGSISNGKCNVQFTNLPYGTYAVSVFHDQNNNNQLERAPLGFPLEPYGISNNSKKLGPPDFESAMFMINSETMSITIEMRSFKKK
jgi:uncharacterized protein (DUF2141 family)